MASVYPTIRRENLSYLRVDERLILLASARALSGNRTSITSKELYQFYRVVCEEMGFDPYGYTFYREKLQHLQDLGYLRLSIKSSNKEGRRTYIYLPGIPATLLEKELIKSFSKEHSTQEYSLRENEDT